MNGLVYALVRKLPLGGNRSTNLIRVTPNGNGDQMCGSLGSDFAIARAIVDMVVWRNRFAGLGKSVRRLLYALDGRHGTASFTLSTNVAN